MVAGVGHVLGLNDVMQERNYTLSVKCSSSSGKLLKISAKDFHSCIEDSEGMEDVLFSIAGDLDQVTKFNLRGRW